MRFTGLVLLLIALGSANAASIGIADAAGYIHANGGLIAQYNQSSPNFFKTLDANNLGTFGFTFANTTGSTLTNVSFFGFLDADIDRNLNTFFNEYGQFVKSGSSLQRTGRGDSSNLLADRRTRLCLRHHP